MTTTTTAPEATYTETSPTGTKLTAGETLDLLTALRKSFLYQTPTIVQSGITSPRVHLAMPLSLYEAMMGLIGKAGGWEMPTEDVAQLRAMFEQTAKDAGKDPDWCKKRNTGELAMAYSQMEGLDDVAGIGELRARIEKELKTRGN